MARQDTEELLGEWGKWARRGGQPLPRYMSSATAVYLRNVAQAGGPAPRITDDEAGAVDAAVARLLRRDEEMGSVIVLHFLHGHSKRQVAALLDLDRRRVDMLAGAAVAWVDGAMAR